LKLLKNIVGRTFLFAVVKIAKSHASHDLQRFIKSSFASVSILFFKTPSKLFGNKKPAKP
jgi:hypothetical protein